MRSARALIAAAALLVAASVTCRAQGAWVGLGLGTGSANIRCNGCPGGWNLHGETGLYSVTMMITPQVGIGVGLDQWVQSPEDSEATNTMTFLVHYYPIHRAGAFVEAGLGPSEAEAGPSQSTTGASGRGLGFMAAVGWDVPLLRPSGANINVTPRLSYVYSSIGDLNYENSPTPFATGWRHQVLSMGLEITLRGWE